jgi:hypothetical protein
MKKQQVQNLQHSIAHRPKPSALLTTYTTPPAAAYQRVLPVLLLFKVMRDLH